MSAEESKWGREVLAEGIISKLTTVGEETLLLGVVKPTLALETAWSSQCIMYLLRCRSLPPQANALSFQ